MDGNDTIDYLPNPPTYDQFLHSYLIPNRPLIIGPSLIASWPCMQDWVTETSSQEHPRAREINWDYLSVHFGDLEVSVADCATPDSLGNQERRRELFRDVVHEWKHGEGRSLYVKDWHLARPVESISRDGAFYTTPDIFRDDWMNAYYSAHTDDDFRFVYVGARGTFTPLHRDVYASYSWSANVCGRKRWWLFPPEDTPCLFVKGRSVTVYDVRHVDPNEFPDFSKARPIVVEQNEGETIFVPSGWYHQVENLTACISINHNWCNSVNLPSLYTSMCGKVAEVENALQDVREMMSAAADSSGSDWHVEWVSVVQDVVKHDAGWNWSTFWQMVLHALRSTSEGHDTFNGEAPLFRSAPAHLTPSSEFIRERVRGCYEDFIQRDRHEGELGVADVVQKVGEHLRQAS